MRTIRCSRLHLFLLTFISITCTPTESVIHLKNITLYVDPASTVERESNLTLVCVAEVIHSDRNLPLLKFSFFKDYNKHNTVHILQTNTSAQVTYTITRAHASHSGQYQCDVTANNQHKESSTVNIIVKGLQTPVLSFDKVNVTEGDTVRVTCSVKGETGELNFFLSDGSKIIYQEKTTSGEVQRNHSLKTVGTASLSCSYNIWAGGELLSSNVSNVVSVAVNQLNLKVSISVLPSTQVIEGDPVHIICDGTGNHDKSPVVILYKGQVLLQKVSPPGQKAEFKAVVLARDSGMYECIAALNDVYKSVYANLTVKELFSKPVLTITPPEVFEREQVTVTCSSSEFASERIGHRDVTFSIYRYKQKLRLHNGTYITTASTETNGNYTCTAQVNDTIKWSRSVILTAKVLVSRPNISVHDEVILGRSFKIECYSDTGSSPIDYTLKRKNTVLGRTTVSRPFQKATFNASITSENEIHDFRCEARNNGVDSAQTSDALLAPVTVPVGKPTLLILPVADDVTEDNEVHFSCSVRNGTPPITFKWYQDENRSPVYTTTVKTNRSTYVLPSVSAVHSGRYYCEALNGAGNEEVSNHIMVTVRIARWKKGLIITLCVLCVTGLALAFLIRYRAKRVKVAGSRRAGIWSERPPVLDSSDVVDVSEEPNVEYTEVLHPQTPDPARVPLRKGTDTVYSEVQRLPPEFCEDC